MSAVVAVLLGLAVTAALVGAVACWRLQGALERLHAGGFVALAGCGLVVLAAILSDGLTVRSGKCLLVFLLALFGNAVATHAVGRAVHLREGMRR